MSDLSPVSYFKAIYTVAQQASKFQKGLYIIFKFAYTRTVQSVPIDYCTYITIHVLTVRCT